MLFSLGYFFFVGIKHFFFLLASKKNKYCFSYQSFKVERVPMIRLVFLVFFFEQLLVFLVNLSKKKKKFCSLF